MTAARYAFAVTDEPRARFGEKDNLIESAMRARHLAVVLGAYAEGDRPLDDEDRSALISSARDLFERIRAVTI